MKKRVGAEVLHQIHECRVEAIYDFVLDGGFSEIPYSFSIIYVSMKIGEMVFDQRPSTTGRISCREESIPKGKPYGNIVLRLTYHPYQCCDLILFFDFWIGVRS